MSRFYDSEVLNKAQSVTKLCLIKNLRELYSNRAEYVLILKTDKLTLYIKTDKLRIMVPTNWRDLHRQSVGYYADKLTVLHALIYIKIIQ